MFIKAVHILFLLDSAAFNSKLQGVGAELLLDLVYILKDGSSKVNHFHCLYFLPLNCPELAEIRFLFLPIRVHPLKNIHNYHLYWVYNIQTLVLI